MKPVTLPVAGFVTGIGLDGFLNGIVLHQILQWDHLVCVSATCEPRSLAEAKAQTAQDGFFHLAVWVVTLAGVVLLFHAARHPQRQWKGRVLAGAMLMGWGVFNLVEGIIDHHLLRIHHVMAGSPHEALADWLFLALSALLAMVGGVDGCRAASCEAALTLRDDFSGLIAGISHFPSSMGTLPKRA